MADSFLDSAGGFTPVPDKLVREYGFEVAYVWGKVWRYCQMANGACTASHETIAKRAGMSRRTLIEKLNVLIRDGYIEDLTPDLKNKPHTYCTTKGEGKITSTMQISHTDITTPASDTDVDMRILHSDDANNAHPNPSTMQNLHTQDAEIAQPTMQNLHLKKDSLETIKETKELTPKGVVTEVTPGAKTILRDKFLELTGLSMPTSKGDVKFWWGNFGEILKLARGDPALACRWEGEAVGYMQSSHLTITGPKSIIGLIGALASGQTLEKSRQNGRVVINGPPARSLDPDKAARYEELAARHKE